MPFVLTIPDNYGYVALIAIGVLPILALGHGAAVTTCRKAARVPYPNPYASVEQVKNSKEAYRFNCAQRAHGNLLENLPVAISTMLFAGLFYPNATALLSVGWVLCRIAFAYGYINSDKPDGRGRMIGSGFWLMQLGLVGFSVAGALKLV